MNILVAVYAPGAAEAIVEVVGLSAASDSVTVITLGALPDDRALGGASAIFARCGVPHTDLRQLNYLGPANAVPQVLAEDLLAQTRPDAVLVGCSRDPSGSWTTLEDALVASAHTRDIVSVQLLDGWDVWFPRNTRVTAGRLAAPDEAARRIVQQRGGVPAEQIVATGQPAVDAIDPSSVQLRREERRASLGVAADERVVLYCGQVSSDNPLTLMWTIDALGPRDRLIFQRHPRDARSYDSVLAAAAGRVLASAPRGDDVFAVADVCVTHSSTVGLRAAAHGLPVVNVLLDGELDDVRRLCGGYPLAALGVSREVHDARALAGALAGNVPRPNAALLRERLHLDGRAAERVHALLQPFPPRVRI